MPDNLKTIDFYKEEDGDNSILSKLDKVLTETSIITSVKRELFFNDEPKLYDYCTTFESFDCNSKKQLAYSGGTDLNKEKALLKSIAEAIERHCLSIQKKEIYTSYGKIKNKAINIFDFYHLSPKQESNPKFKDFVYTENDNFFWCHGYSVFGLEKKMIPSQLISVPYKYSNEKIIRESISTGAALSTSLGGSIYRGICEIIERDAFMIAYLNKTKKCLIDLKKTGNELRELSEISDRYKLEPIIVDITNDLGIPVMMGIVIDRTGIGPAISVGLSADLDPKIAAIKSIKEAFHSRPWIRKLMIQKIKNTDINTFEGRALYWSKPEMIEKLDFLIKGKKYPLTNNIQQDSIKEKLNKFQIIFKKQNLSAFFINLTTPEIREYGFFVSKVIIPKLVPLYLNERFKDIYHPRLNQKKINKIPHPFL